jgi:hypothetical protein
MTNPSYVQNTWNFTSTLLHTHTFYVAWCLGKQTAVTWINVNLRVVSEWLNKMRYGPRQIVQGRDNNLEITVKCLSINIFLFIA